MAEILDDYEQGERVKKWLQSYVPSILLGLGVAGAGLLGANYWSSHKLEQRLDAAANYALLNEQLTELTQTNSIASPNAGDDAQVDDSSENSRVAVEQAYQALKNEHSDNLYAGLAGLLLADNDVVNNELDAAVIKYQQVISQSSPTIADLARLRLARTQVAADQPDAALRVLDAITTPDYYSSLVARTRGDAYLNKGDNAAALEAYTQAEEELGGTPDPLLTYRLAQLRELDVEALLTPLTDATPVPSFNNIPLNNNSSNVTVTPAAPPSSVDIEVEENNGAE